MGAVVVRDDVVVGDGFHQRFGQEHAEVNALRAAGRDAQNATLYVTLEPCCHFSKTPPCTDAIVRSGVKRVIAAMADPFPEVSGQGIEQLKKHGIEIVVGLCEAEARRLNGPYLKLLATNRSYVHLKWAMTLDGKICTRTGDSKWISNDTILRQMRAFRGRMDAIVIGIGTALADDPLLTARPPGPRLPTRIVLDSHARLPAEGQLAKTARQAPLMVVTTEGVSNQRQAELQALGAEVLPLPALDGKPSIPALLDELGRRRMTNLLIEGGSEVLGSFIDADAVDEVHVCIAPRLVGGSRAKSPVGGGGVERIQDALTLPEWQVDVIDGNLIIHGRRR